MSQALLSGMLDYLRDIASERLREFEPPEGYWLAFSGGKDSQVIHRLAELAGVKFTAHRNVVPLEPPELGRFIRRHYPEMIWERPTVSFRAMLLSRQFPPTRTKRWCCGYLKEGAGSGTIITGVRAAESRQRAKRRLYEACYRGKESGRHYLNPILDWSTAHVWAFIRDQQLPYCSLYDPPPRGRGWTRIGCLMCPCASRQKRARDAKAYPRTRAWLVRLFDDLVQMRRENGKPFENWTTGEELFEWWIADKRRPKQMPDAEGQVMIYE